MMKKRDLESFDYTWEQKRESALQLVKVAKQNLETVRTAAIVHNMVGDRDPLVDSLDLALMRIEQSLALMQKE